MADRAAREHLEHDMSPQRRNNAATMVTPLASLGRRAVTSSMRPFATVTMGALHAGMALQRRAVERVLESPELDRTLTAAINSEPAQDAISRAMESDAAKQLVAAMFEAGLFDQLVDRLLASEALWRLVDEVAASPSVTAAITQQGLGFADQVGDQVRTRSRNADEWLDRAARRLARRRGADPAPGTGAAPYGAP
jgi:hypothetical protein